MERKSSQIWKVHTERIGSLEAFKSEYDMEAFLMNNPLILGYRSEDPALSQPILMKQQLGTKAKEGAGRIDICGLFPKGETYELLIFELKNGEIDIAAVNQLSEYIDGWHDEKGAKQKIKQQIKEFGLGEVVEDDLERAIENPIGVLVGTNFLAEAISKANANKLKGIRLARFRAEERGEYYVIIEDQIGDVISTGRLQWSWHNLISEGLIGDADIFVIEYKGNSLRGQPDKDTLTWAKKRIILDADSTKRILDVAESLKQGAGELERKWLPKTLDSLRHGKPIYITNATGLAFLAFGGPTKSYWVPLYWWIHEKSKKKLDEIVNSFMSTRGKR